MFFFFFYEVFFILGRFQKKSVNEIMKVGNNITDLLGVKRNYQKPTILIIVIVIVN